MTSGTEPQRNARTGVPHDMASIITSPNGSGQSTGNNRAAASPKNFVFSRSLIPDELYAWAINKREYILAEVVLIDLVDLGGDLQRDASGVRYSNRAIRALFRRNPSQEGKVAALLERRSMQVSRNTVVDGRNKIGVRQ